LCVGIISIFADCNCEKDYSKKKESKFIEPFPAGTQKVPYVRDELTTNNNLEEGRSDTAESNNNNYNNEKNDIIQVDIVQKEDDEYTQEKTATANPYDVPEDF
jgi:hypothetical protein